MLTLIFIALGLALYLGLPLTIRVSRLLNLTIAGMSTSELVRILFGYVFGMTYNILMIFYLIHIDHPVLIIALLVPALLGYMIQTMVNAK